MFCIYHFTVYLPVNRVFTVYWLYPDVAFTFIQYFLQFNILQSLLQTYQTSSDG